MSSTPGGGFGPRRSLPSSRFSRLRWASARRPPSTRWFTLRCSARRIFPISTASPTSIMPTRATAAADRRSLSRADFEDYRVVQTSFEFLAAWQAFRLPLAAEGSAEWVMGESVGGEYFSVVGIQPALGRLIQPADDTPNAPRVIVLSDALWRRHFVADPTVAGRVVKLGGETFEIIGVAPPAFRGVSMPNVLPTAAWIPLSAAPVSDAGDLTDRERRRSS